MISKKRLDFLLFLIVSSSVIWCSCAEVKKYDPLAYLDLKLSVGEKTADHIELLLDAKNMGGQSVQCLEMSGHTVLFKVEAYVGSEKAEYPSLLMFMNPELSGEKRPEIKTVEVKPGEPIASSMVIDPTAWTLPQWMLAATCAVPMEFRSGYTYMLTAYWGTRDGLFDLIKSPRNSDRNKDPWPGKQDGFIESNTLTIDGWQDKDDLFQKRLQREEADKRKDQ